MPYVIATMQIKPGKNEEIKAAAAPLLVSTRAEAGCIRYDLTQDTSNPDVMIFIEEWRSKEDVDLHMTQPHVLAWREKATPLIQSRTILVIEAASVVTL